MPAAPAWRRQPRERRARLRRLLLAAALAAPGVGLARGADAAVLLVPDSFPTIQAGLDAARPGDRVQVAAGVYFERLHFPRSGNAVAGPIVLEAAPGARPVLDGSGVPGSDLVRIESRSFVTLRGFELRNNLEVEDGSGIRILGHGSRLEISNNHLHALRGNSAMAITVYGSEAQSISELSIDGNVVYDCEPAPSEAIVVNGNVERFRITGNLVRDVDNIGIDVIGGERDIQPDPDKVARSGVVAGNRVERARASYGGGFAAGIYVDGGRDILVERNVVTGSDLGIEVGAENAGIVASGIVVRNNLLFANEKACLVFGGYAPEAGRVRGSTFRNNTCFGNDTLQAGFGELWIQHAEDNVVENNLFVAGAGGLLVVAEPAAARNALDHNLYSTAGGAPARFQWRGSELLGLAAFRAASGQDASSLLADPLLLDPATADFHLAAASPAVDAGDPALVPGPDETDLDDGLRLWGAAIDIGADEWQPPARCLPSPTRLCLGDGRFAVEAEWRTPSGDRGPGHAVGLTTDTGYLWFFDPANVEVVVKVLNGCALNDRHWVFAGGLTDLALELRLGDAASGARRTYRNPAGTPFQPILDTAAFATCP